MTLQTFVEQYGLVAVFLGCMLEGETTLVMGGVAAHLRYLALPEVIGVAAVAGFLGDLLWFQVGRTFGPRLLQRNPGLAQRVERARTFVEHHGDWIVVFMRFAIGLRTAIPLALGAGGMKAVRYFLLNAIGAVLWAATGASAGYVFGAAVVSVLHEAQRDVGIAMAVAMVAGLGWIVVRAYLARRRRAVAADSGKG